MVIEMDSKMEIHLDFEMEIQMVIEMDSIMEIHLEKQKGK